MRARGRAVLAVISEELLEHVVEGRAFRQIGHLLSAVRFLFLDRLGRRNIHHRLGDAVDEISEGGGPALRHRRRDLNKGGSARQASRQRQRDPAATTFPPHEGRGKQRANAQRNGRLGNAHGVFLLIPKSLLALNLTIPKQQSCRQSGEHDIVPAGNASRAALWRQSSPRQPEDRDADYLTVWVSGVASPVDGGGAVGVRVPKKREKSNFGLMIMREAPLFSAVS